MMPLVNVDDATSLVEFYERGLGALQKRRVDHANGLVAFAVLQLDDAQFCVRDDPERPVPPTESDGTVGFVLPVDDVDVAFRRALGAGAVPVHAPEPGNGEHADVLDPAGLQWTLVRRDAPTGAVTSAAAPPGAQESHPFRPREIPRTQRRS